MSERGYKRRKCGSCGDELGFTELDPCDRCAVSDEVASAATDDYDPQINVDVSGDFYEGGRD